MQGALVIDWISSLLKGVKCYIHFRFLFAEGKHACLGIKGEYLFSLLYLRGFEGRHKAFSLSKAA